ncbi:MAG TPA: long-chain fatty acid--CoA ligase [Propionibacteriaceae bacterium]
MTEREIIEAKCPPSVGAMLRRRVQLTPARPAFQYPDARDAWKTYTWSDVGELSDAIAAGLLGVGVEHEQRVAIASTTCVEWILACYGTALAGAATTTIYPNTTDEDVAYILSDSGSVVAFVEDAEQAAKITAHPELDEQVRVIVLFTGTGDGDRIVGWDEFLGRGRAYAKEHPDAVKKATEATGPDTLATLIYTSGTTGQPKGVELVHQSWTYLAVAIDTMHFIDMDDLQFLWLPLSHVFGNCLLFIQLQIGFSSAVDGRLDRIVANLGEVKPTFMCGAPRIFEKVRSAVLTGENSVGLKGSIARWAFAKGRAAMPYRLEGKPLPKLLAVQYAVADRLVFSKLRDRLGGRMKFMVSGSAKLSRQIQAWFYSAGLLIVEGYGLTETSAVAHVNHWSEPKFGTVGRVAPGMDRMIAGDGEVLVRGPLVMRGYHNSPEATAEAIDAEGWFHTGDIGILDDKGFLRITDRKKDLMKTSGGKYVAPQKVEGTIVANVPLVSQAIAVGDGQKYIGALLVLEPDALRRWAERTGKAGLGYAEMTRLPGVRHWIDHQMKRANSKLERWETVKKYAILDHELTVDSGEVTPNMKVRRANVVKDNQEIVDALFETNEEDGL